jgi:hypothetical protein
VASAAALQRDGPPRRITLDNCGGVDLDRMRTCIIEEAQKIALAEVYGFLDDEDTDALLEES